MAVRVGINGFGRIGRNVLRAARERSPDLEIVAVNDITTPEELAHLLKYDSVLGRYPGTVAADATASRWTDARSRCSPSAIPQRLPWRDLGVDVVVESTGLFTDGEKARGHLEAGAARRDHRAPAKHEDITVVHGRQRRHVQPRGAPHHLQRLLHDELPGAGRQGPQRLVRHRDRAHDHGPRVHQGPGDPRRAAQGPAPGAARPRCRSSPRRPAPPRP